MSFIVSLFGALEVFTPGEIQHSKFWGCGLFFILFLFYKIEEGILWHWRWQRTKAKACPQVNLFSGEDSCKLRSRKLISLKLPTCR